MIDKLSQSTLYDAEHEARELSLLMPELILSARQIAQTLVHGSHGRKRAGPGETFWQFRPYESFEPQQNIDWRRSASSDNLYVREREWDAAHTFWLWIDLSPSMWFRSHLSDTSKAVRSIVIGLAIAEMLVRSGERVGVMGLMRPRSGRDILPQIGQRLLHALSSDYFKDGLPPNEKIDSFTELIFISDFLEEFSLIDKQLRKFGSQRTRGTLVQVIDPAEESLPYSGRVEFKDMQSSLRVIIENAAKIRTQYETVFNERKLQLSETTRQLSWGHLQHHTDRPVRESLLHLYGFLSNHMALQPASSEVRNNKEDISL